MCKLNMRPFALAGAIIIIQSVGCAPPRKPIQDRTGIITSTEIDSTDAAAYEELFTETYGEILEELERKENSGASKNVLIEARSIVKIAEEMYLEGNVPLAVKLLIEVESLLKSDSMRW